MIITLKVDIEEQEVRRILIWIWRFLLAGAFFLSVAGEGFSQELIEVSIEGKIVNETIGGEVPSDQEVVLLKHQSGEWQRISSTRSDEEGNFELKDLHLAQEGFYFLSTLYNGVEYYFSEMIKPNKDSPAVKGIIIKVYESTPDDKDIKVKAHNIVIEAHQDHLVVQEYTVFVNRGDRTYTGAGGDSTDKVEGITFSFPPDIVEPEILSGLNVSDIVSTGDGFASTEPFQPGAREVILQYKIKNNPPKYSFIKRLDYPTDGFRFLVVDSGVGVSSKMLTPSEPVSIEGKKYLSFSGDNLGAGTQVSVEISGLTRRFNKESLRWVAIGLVGLVILAGIPYYYLSGGSKTQKGSSSGGRGEEKDLTEKRKKLLGSIAELDNKFERNQIPENEYAKLRKDVKEELIEITLKLRKG